MEVAWHLALNGVEAHIFEARTTVGRQAGPDHPLGTAVPGRLGTGDRPLPEHPQPIHVNFGVAMSKDKFAELKKDFDYVVMAVGTHQPRTIPFPGHERVIPALDYLKAAKSDKPMPTGKQVVIIGAGNVGCDVAAEAYRLGAEQVTLVDIQKPLAFGKEKDAAEALGAIFKWPVMTREVTRRAWSATTAPCIPAQTVIISIGDVPSSISCRIPWRCVTVGGAAWIKTDEAGRTSDAKILAVGDVERPGLATNALGAGKRAAEYHRGRL